MSDENELIFVYGTLKVNQPNNGFLLNCSNGKAELVCNAKTCERYPMFVATRYNSVFCVKLPGIGHEIHGEIYRVDKKMFANLDILEGSGNAYERQQVTIKGNDG